MGYKGGVSKLGTKCIKITIEYDSSNIINKKDLHKELFDLRYKLFLACNRAITYLYNNDMQNLLKKDIGLPKQDDKDIYGKSFGAWIENRINEYVPGALSNNIAQTRQFVTNRYSSDKKKGLLSGKVSLTRFKIGIPIIIHNKAYKIIDTPKGLGIELGLFNTAKQIELGVKRIKFYFPKLNSSEKTTVRRLFDGSYKCGTAQLMFNEKKNKWMIAISYSFNDKQKVVNNDLVMGIDLGITKVATISILDTKTNDYIWLKYKECMIDGEEIIHYRQKIEARRKQLYIASKWSSKNNTGNGYKARMKTANSTSDKYSRFRDTYNHKISKYIVDLAIKYNVGCIQMENLSGFSDNQSESLLKNWSYYDLQSKIEYKSKEQGIEVIFINPKYTSQRCNVCGCISSENRNCKNNQAKFKCVQCGHEDNADINASKNIAIPDIENIIKEYK